MPGAVARTSTFALNNATLPFVMKLAKLGPEAAMAADPHLASGLNVSAGKIRHKAVAEALGMPFEPASPPTPIFCMVSAASILRSCSGSHEIGRASGRER